MGDLPGRLHPGCDRTEEKESLTLPPGWKLRRELHVAPLTEQQLHEAQKT